MHASILSKKPKRFCVVEALIFNSKGEILLLKRSKNNSLWVNKWQLPGGKLENDESFMHAIKREIKEESDLSSSDISLKKVFCFRNNFKGKNECVLLKVYSCNLAKSPISLSIDHSSFKFVNPKKIKKSSLTEMSKVSIFGL